MNNQKILEVKDICKSFHGNAVLKNICFDVKQGEVHAVVGENGAGKSTLINIIGGIIHSDSGEIIFNGEKTNFNNPIQAMQSGISIVHQELSLCENLSVEQNVFLRREKTNALGFIKWKDLRKEVEDIFKMIDVEINPTEAVGQLSVGLQQIVEIAKAISIKAKVIIMDEPTSSLSSHEIERLFKLIENLKRKGISIVFISHKISEILSISDRVSVLRDGIMISTKKTSDTDATEIINGMVGRELNNLYPDKNPDIKEKVFECKKISRKGYFRDISFDLNQGEILGLYGLVGAGRTEVVRTLIGADKLDGGLVYIKGKNVRINSPKKAIQKGICYLTEDRKSQGLFLPFSVRNNICAASIRNYCSKIGFIKEKPKKEIAKDLIERLEIKTTDDRLEVENLSGGNQQKVLLAEWIALNPKILIVDEPTRGVDVGAKAVIHQKLRELTKQGLAIIMVSSELPEIIGLSDRVVVFNKGQITAILDNSKSDISQDEILKSAIG